MIEDGITYLSYNSFKTIFKKIETEKLNKIITIVDEFDSVIFCSEDSLREANEVFPKV